MPQESSPLVPLLPLQKILVTHGLTFQIRKDFDSVICYSVRVIGLLSSEESFHPS